MSKGNKRESSNTSARSRTRRKRKQRIRKQSKSGSVSDGCCKNRRKVSLKVVELVFVGAPIRKEKGIAEEARVHQKFALGKLHVLIHQAQKHDVSIRIK